MASDAAKAKKFSKYNKQVANGTKTPHSGGGKSKQSGYKPDPNYQPSF